MGNIDWVPMIHLAEVRIDLAMNNLHAPLMHPIRKDSGCLAMGYYYYTIMGFSYLAYDSWGGQVIVATVKVRLSSFCKEKAYVVGGFVRDTILARGFFQPKGDIHISKMIGCV